MWLKSTAYSHLFMALLLFYYDVMPTSATDDMAQLKNQQQILGQTSTISIQHQQHANQIVSQTQHQQQQQHQLQKQPLQSADIAAAHPANGISSNANSVLHGSSRRQLNTETQALPVAFSSSSTPTSASAHLPLAQYVMQDKEIAMQEILKRFSTENEFNDSYQIFNELKRGPYENTNHELPPSIVPTLASNMDFYWNFYNRHHAPSQVAGLFSHNLNPFEIFSPPVPVMPRLMPFMSYPQPVYVPYPFVMSPEMFYPGYSSPPDFANDYEDSMSRGAGSSRHSGTSHSRNSPIYYVRLPPTPYMFLPSLRLGTTTTPRPGYPNISPYRSLSSFPSFSSIYNVPINFLANGKPNNIYQMGAPPNDLQNHLQFSNIPSSLNSRPPQRPPLNIYRPEAPPPNYFNTQHSSASSQLPNYGSYPGTSTVAASPTTSSSSTFSHPDSKLTVLKHPYFFNGHPEDIYILPNNFNSLYSSESSYF